MFDKATETVIYDYIKEVLSTLETKKCACGIFLDLAIAFDCVNHKLLIAKLERDGIWGIAQSWFVSDLANKKQFVQIKDRNTKQHLKLKENDCGVSQGGTLGPLYI